MNKMPCHITDLPDPDDRPEVDEEIRDALEVEPFPDDLIEAIMDIGRSVELLKSFPFGMKQG